MSSEQDGNSARGIFRLILGLVGFPLFSVAGFMTVYGFWRLLTDGVDATGVVLLALFGGAALAGLMMIVKAIRGFGSASRVTSNEMRERQILELARLRGGMLTLGEIAVETNLDVKGARAILDELELHGVADLQISQGGQQVYVFSGFSDSGADKLTARSMFETAEEVELAHAPAEVDQQG